ncbi:hypothetical protein [Thauera aromatica]|uniref:hypothetical protein n=1 Tax=Thauera aromatica TaxID=59405 RepID=UPI001FFDB801|nr:hypothetical protein [Thauera aromatica]MCK2094402.1 hypothetical protein [Thauera aromatica]
MTTFSYRKVMAAIASCTAVVMTGVSPALAVNPADYFQLDGNLTDGDLNSTPTKPDWTDIFQGKLPTGEEGATAKASLPAGFSATTFIADFNIDDTKDVSLFATGSKDTLNITPGWECKRTNNVNDKTDINNAYAVARTVVVNGTSHLIVYFALDVAANDGTKNVAFWFLKDPDVGCVANGAFVGNHSDGDVLIVSEFTNGGAVSTIKAYQWVGGAGGYLDTNPVASGGECNGASFDVCAKVNTVVLNGTGTGNGDQVPWLVKTKKGSASPDYNAPTDLDIGEFFEGGIDLTALGISGCFNRYLADTRSSTSLTSTIFDYALGDFSNCSIGASKTCAAASVNADFLGYTSPFTVTITNTSPSGMVYDVSFKETYNFGDTGETCKITSNNGDQNVTDVDITSGNVVMVDSELPAGQSVTVGISCTGPMNSFQDSIFATAGSAPGLSDIEKAAVVDSDTATACEADVQADLTLTKVCTGMELVGGTSSTTPITLRAKVAITVTNTATSNELVTLTSVTDNKVAPADLAQVVCGSNPPTPASDVVLSPGETACFIGSYTPTTADLVNPPIPPSTAAFNDTANASGEGSLSDEVINAPSATATCNLCDSDVDGTPDVIDADSGP